jgi:hypothetical protein
MKKYLLVIARYADKRQQIFDDYISPDNRKYCEKWGFEYLEIKNEHKLELFRGNPTWWKFTILRDMMESGFLKDGDIFTHLDADMIIANHNREYSTSKSFSYSIDSGNTHCMGNYSIKINEWSRNMVRLLLDDERFSKLGKIQSIHPVVGRWIFWDWFREQASWYSLSGIKNHSDVSFFDLPNYGWHSDFNEYTYYSLDELNEHVEILSQDWNVTELEGETSGTYNINKSKTEDVIIRHFAGGQVWNTSWLGKNNNLTN